MYGLSVPAFVYRPAGIAPGDTLDVAIPADSAAPGAAIRAAFIAEHRRAYGHTRDAPVRLERLHPAERAVIVARLDRLEEGA